MYDDLEWLVGTWVCVKRVLTQDVQPAEFAVQGAERVERLNVYYPFSYGEMSLVLRRIPQRVITAEFLVTTHDGQQLPTDPGSPVLIGIDKIVIGYPAPFAIEFTYKRWFDECDSIEMLELTSERARLVLKKTSDYLERDSRLSTVMPPDMKLLRQWKHDYQQLKFEWMNADRVKGR